MRFKVLSSNQEEAAVLVEGRVELLFRMYEGKLWKVSSSSYDRKSAVVSRNDFLEARKIAGQEIMSHRSSSIGAPATNPEEIANAIFLYARKWCKGNIGQAASEYRELRNISPELMKTVWQTIGRRGGQAAKAAKEARIQARARAAQKIERETREPQFNFGHGGST